MDVSSDAARWYVVSLLRTLSGAFALVYGCVSVRKKYAKVRFVCEKTRNTRKSVQSFIVVRD